MEKVLLYFSLKYNGNWDKIYSALENKEKILHSQLEDIENNIDCDFITILNPLYPSYLKTTHKPPFVIFYKGNIELITKYNKNISVIGGKEFSDQGLKNTYKIIKELNEEKRIIVTYQNAGINDAIIDLCKEENYESIVVLSNSMKSYLDLTKNSSPTNNKLYISENYNSCEIDKILYSEYVNRLICGLSKGLLFTQYSFSDSYFSLVNYAINEGKEIFAMPSNDKKLNETNKLIKMGAKFTENAKDIVNEI
ncbi:DNA processing/uptake protein [Spiroplasma gladiatoris]|uniref:DNA processing/uptake protein n=1 Tax=Spiroplasma gladiatoris TaxID=2143 RepID=A0A4P7AHC8_9MOLU|nr:DNA-processing protein DprA [Spiroplasma gladiatoris]QBQ07531.1 DNA processing/uptake protein [Spiroplasma gladiatoris]